jgi:electron transfer flavoprotein beta subunit
MVDAECLTPESSAPLRLRVKQQRPEDDFWVRKMRVLFWGGVISGVKWEAGCVLVGWVGAVGWSRLVEGFCVKMVVCIKQVPGGDRLVMDRERGCLNRSSAGGLMNPFDEPVLEYAFRLRDQYGGHITVLTMGPPQAEQVLRTALSHGADEAVLLSDRAFGGSDTLATSYVLSRAIERLGGVDLVLFGRQTLDSGTAQVGPGTAALLDWPMLANVRRVERVGGVLRVEQVTEAGYEEWEVLLPCALAIAADGEELRMPGLESRRRARRLEIPCWGVGELGVDVARVGLAGSPTKVLRLYTPESKQQRELLRGSPREMVRLLIERLKEHAVL